MLTPATPPARSYAHELELSKMKSVDPGIAMDSTIYELTLASTSSPQYFSRDAQAETGHIGKGNNLHVVAADLSCPSPMASMKDLRLYYRDSSTEHQNTPPRYAASGNIRSRAETQPSIGNPSVVVRGGKVPTGNDSVGILQRSCFSQVLHPSDNTELEWVDENRVGAEFGYEDEDEDADQDEYELGECDDMAEICSDGNGSRIDLRISSASLDNIQSHVSGHGEKEKGKLPTPRKRSAPQGFNGNSQNDIRDTGDSAGNPSKRPKEQKGARDVLHHQSKRPFACPYFKKNPLKYVDCADWRNTKLSLVKTHCMSEHLKSRCPRCKNYRGIQSEIVKHLEEEDCEKPETYDSSEEKATEEKIQELNKAKTWRRIYEILFPLYIPDQFWQHTIEALVVPNDEDELPFTDRVQLAVSIRERAYRVAISELFRDRAGAEAVDELLHQFDKVLESKAWSQDSPNGINNSRAITYNTQTHWSLPKEPPKTEQSSTSSFVHDSTTSQHDTQSKEHARTDSEQFHNIATINSFPSQPQYSVEQLISTQGPANPSVNLSNFPEFHKDLLGHSFTNDPGSQDMHDYVNVDDDMFEYGGDEAFEDIAEDFLEPGGMGYSL